MAKFNKPKKETPAIQTSSLPDIVFMLIFFFMVATVIRKNTLQVTNVLPQATEITKVANKSLTEYLFVGTPKDIAVRGTAPRLQLDDKLCEVSEVGPFVETKRNDQPDPALRNKITWSLKVDQNTKMGIVTDVKQELRKVDALKINYSSHEKVD